MSTKSITNNFKQRDQEIGAILLKARQRATLTQEECARAVGTTRRRYGLMERGELSISIVEFEVLVRFLNIPISLILSDLMEETSPRQVLVQAEPGEVVQVVVQVRGD